MCCMVVFLCFKFDTRGKKQGSKIFYFQFIEKILVDFK